MRLKRFFCCLLLFCVLGIHDLSCAPGGSLSEEEYPLLYFQPNITPLFSELYDAYGLSPLPRKTFFEEAIYLDQSTPGSILPMQPSNQIVFGHTNDVLSAFHRKIGDFELYADPQKPEPFFYAASGAKHLIVALVYAVATSEPHKKFLFVEKAPFYSGHPNAVTGIFSYPNARFLAFHDPSEIILQPGEELVEFVTSPNNPDGTFRTPLTDARIVIADFVFASSAFGSDGTGYCKSNLEWIKQARLSGKHVFSFNSASKQFGMTGCRFGYIWYPLYDPYAASIFKKFFSFISNSTIGAGTVGLARFLDLIKALLHTSDAGEALRHDAHKSLLRRHILVEQEFLRRYPGSTILSIPGSPTFFAKVHDQRIPSKRASDVLLEDLHISVNSGDTMGESDEFIRLNLCGDSVSLTELLNRLSKEKKYTNKDFW
jgi:aspartate/methionine/tyrosine aminotransferase